VQGGDVLTRIEKSIEINAPKEKVWSLLEWEKTPEWYEPFKKVVVTSKEKNVVGETAHISGEIAGVKAEWDAETTEIIENKKHAWRSIGGSFTGFESFEFSPANAGTKLTAMMDYEMPYSVFGKLIDKLRVHKAMEKSVEEGLKNLKGMAEKQDS
jgi:uncharacterized membrane protein